jgi:hypothetical protein
MKVHIYYLIEEVMGLCEPLMQIPSMWEGLQNMPQMNFNPGVAADSGTNNSGIYMILSILFPEKYKCP